MTKHILTQLGIAQCLEGVQTFPISNFGSNILSYITSAFVSFANESYFAFIVSCFMRAVVALQALIDLAYWVRSESLYSRATMRKFENS